jgi:hypothetical protein
MIATARQLATRFRWRAVTARHRKRAKWTLVETPVEKPPSRAPRLRQ